MANNKVNIKMLYGSLDKILRVEYFDIRLIRIYKEIKMLWVFNISKCGHIVGCMTSHSQIKYSFFWIQFTSFSRLFHSYRDEPIGRWGETGVSRENHLTHLQAEPGLSHMWPVQSSNLHQSQR